MRRTRIIPCLLMRDGGLVKTRRFKDPVYVGDPINAIRIFNDKEVDELCLLDIGATAGGREPDFELLSEIASECFMPLAYGGGVRSLATIRRILTIGVEKVVINSAAVDAELIRQASSEFGAQAIVVALDVGKSLLGGYKAYVRNGSRALKGTIEDLAVAAVEAGAGEIFVQSIDRDGMQTGYDLALIQRVAEAVPVPVIAAGGARGVDDFRAAIVEGRASAAAAGSLFVFHGKHRAVLISYPAADALDAALP